MATLFQKLEIVTVPDILTKVSRIEIGVSQFLGIDQAIRWATRKISLHSGYDRIEIPFRERICAWCIDIFEALSSKRASNPQGFAEYVLHRLPSRGSNSLGNSTTI